ncbi:hypothetical protein ACODH8_09825 [Vagococcus fluvialis]|uniref:hypothetical protein n=1 Tax=Vagococcus fluvialis TaxID=2738 RepID=UPI003B5B8E8B
MNERLIDRYLKINISEADQSLMTTHNEVGVYGQTVEVTYHDSNLGNGKVPFFICPSCRNARRDLYLKENEWRCYKCHDLVYYSQQRTKSNPRYWYRRAENEARKIDSDFRIKDLNDVFNHWWIFPEPKPKNMKWSKFNSILFWYDMYMFRGTNVLYEVMCPRKYTVSQQAQNCRLEQGLLEIKNSGN